MNTKKELLIKLIIQMDNLISYTLLGFRWLNHQWLIKIDNYNSLNLTNKDINLDYISLDHTPNNIIKGFNLDLGYPYLFLKAQTKSEKGNLNKIELNKLTILNNNYYSPCIDACFQIIFLKYYLQQLEQFEIINNINKIDIDNCFNNYKFDDPLNLKLILFCNEINMKDNWFNLQEQATTLFHNISYSLLKYNYNIKNINFFFIERDNNFYSYLTDKKFLIEILIKHIDLLQLHYDNFNKEEAITNYNFILKLINSDIIRLSKNINNN